MLAQLDFLDEVGNILFIDEEVSVQVAILDELRIQVSELLSHEFDSPASCCSAHVLNHRHHV